MMLSCRLSAGNRWQVFYCLLSILALLDAQGVTSPSTSATKSTSHTSSMVETTRQTMKATPSITTKSSTPGSTTTEPQTTASTIAANETTKNSVSSATPTTIQTNTTNATTSQNSTSNNLLETSTHPVVLNTSLSESTTRTTTDQVTTTDSTTSHVKTTLSQKNQFHVTCLTLGNQNLTSEALFFEYKKKVNCDTLEDAHKDKMKSIICNYDKGNYCNVTLYTSQVHPLRILWIPAASEVKTIKEKLEKREKEEMFDFQLKWGYISDRQTRSQKTMIALITCGILIAILILASYFLSNKRRWSPGRQRLGEDPYYIENDSQGNTLVSVSTHDQNKPNSGSQENGKGQAITPNSTNGHSMKKSTVSDTEL